MWWNIHAKFRIGDYQFKEVDITPALGVMLILSIVFLVGRTTW
jgi:biopolymer transport protein ExbD